jgi:hypothetical protein
VRSYHVCEEPGEYVYCFESDCVLDERKCSVSNANLNGGNCASFGLAGKCDAVGTCNLDDTKCTTTSLGSSCVDNNRVGYCTVDNEQVEALCSRYRNDKEAYYLCEQTLPGAVVCDVTVACNSGASNAETCSLRGHDGVCQEMCTDYRGNSKTQLPCPTPSNSTFFTFAESQSVCGWSYDPTFCSQQLSSCRIRNDTYRVDCVFQFASIYPQTECVRHDTGCQREFDFCLENNKGGICLQNPNGLYCHDRSDDCPKGALCNTDTGFAFANNNTGANSSHVYRVGQCTGDFYCEARYEPCVEPQQRECWEGGLKGSCTQDSQDPFDAFRMSRCLLDDTPVCSTARLNEPCAAHGFASECAFSYDVISHYCPELEEEGCYYTEYGVICYGTMVPYPTRAPVKPMVKRQTKPDVPPPLSMEDCVTRILAAKEVPTCLTNAYCSVSGSSSSTDCTVDGAPGQCSGRCYAYATATSKIVDIECGLGLLMTYADVNKLVTAICEADGLEASSCVPGRIQLPTTACLDKSTVNNYNRECVFNLLRVSRELRCVRNDKKCVSAGQFCIENGLSGSCVIESNKLVCHEMSDECPAGQPCKLLSENPYPYATPTYYPGPYPYPYPTDYPYYPPGFPEGDKMGGSSGGSSGSAGSGDIIVERDGLCTAEFECRVRHQECGAPDPQKCWINGVAGQCISKSKSQEAQLQQCVQTARDPASCYNRYSTCFTSCRYPTQVCGKSNLCEFDSVGALNCQAIFGEPGLVAEFKQHVILIQVSGQSIYSVSMLVYQSLSENGLGHLSFSTIDSTIGYVLLGPEQSLSKVEFDALAAVAQQLRVTNGVTDAFVVLGGKTITEPTELCGKLKCSSKFKCSDSKCVRALEHGLCQEITPGDDALCVCELGWRGTDCAESDSVKTGETKLSQWVFDKTKVDAQTARSKVASAFDSTVEGVKYELVVTDTVDFVTVRVYLMMPFRDLTSAQVAEIRSAHNLLHGVPGIASSNVYFPVPTPVASGNGGAVLLVPTTLLFAAALLASAAVQFQR